MTDYFKDIAPIRYEGPNTTNPLAYRWYDENRVVLGKTMKEQLRFAVCYWHNFCWNGFDPFSHTGTLERPWWTIQDPMAAAKAKLVRIRMGVGVSWGGRRRGRAQTHIAARRGQMALKTSNQSISSRITRRAVCGETCTYGSEEGH